MSWSLNEIESLARKAARGSGLSWGLAEEAGRSTRWLCAMDLPGADCLAGLLQQNDGADYTSLCPEGSGTAWAAPGGILCPLITGAALCDRAAELACGRRITLADTAYPLLLYPHVATAADRTGAALRLSWPGVLLTRKAGVSTISARDGAAAAAAVDGVDISIAAEYPGIPVKRAFRGDISPQTAGILKEFAHRTYAPETEESRLGGAGAGLTDND